MTRQEWDIALFMLSCAAVMLWSVIQLFAVWLARREERRGEPVFDRTAVHVGIDWAKPGSDRTGFVTYETGHYRLPTREEVERHLGAVDKTLPGTLPPQSTDAYVAAILYGPTAPEPNEQ